MSSSPPPSGSSTQATPPPATAVVPVAMPQRPDKVYMNRSTGQLEVLNMADITRDHTVVPIDPVEYANSSQEHKDLVREHYICLDFWSLKENFGIDKDAERAIYYDPSGNEALILLKNSTRVPAGMEDLNFPIITQDMLSQIRIQSSYSKYFKDIYDDIHGIRQQSQTGAAGQNPFLSQRPPKGSAGVYSIDSLFASDPRKTVFLIPSNVDLEITEAVAPGVFSSAKMKRIAPNLNKICFDLFGVVDNETIGATMLLVVQMIVMAMTSMSTDASDVEPVSMDFKGQRYSLDYPTLREALVTPFAGEAEKNPIRRFTRFISRTIINWVSAGKVTPNIKLMAKWGVPPQFYPYVIDGVIPDPAIDGLSAVAAKIMASMSAIKQAQQLESKVIHNAMELTSMKT